MKPKVLALLGVILPGFRTSAIAVKFLAPSMLALGVAACSAPPLPELSPSDGSSPDASTVAAPYQPVMSGTAPYVPVGLKPWRELNDGVAPGAGRSR